MSRNEIRFAVNIILVCKGKRVVFYGTQKSGLNRTISVKVISYQSYQDDYESHILPEQLKRKSYLIGTILPRDLTRTNFTTVIS